MSKKCLKNVLNVTKNWSKKHLKMSKKCLKNIFKMPKNVLKCLNNGLKCTLKKSKRGLNLF